LFDDEITHEKKWFLTIFDYYSTCPQIERGGWEIYNNLGDTP